MSQLPCSLTLLLLLSTLLLFETVNTQSNTTNIAGVEMPPAITAASPKLMYFRADVADSKLLECAAVGSPVPTYQWYKNNMILDLNQPNIKPQGQGSILISPLAIGDAGLYQCIATNTWGSAATNVISFQLATLSPFTGSGIATQSLNQGSPCALDCRPPSSVPAASYTWVKSNGQNDQFPTPLALNDRVQIDQVTGNLHFANVLPSDSTTGSILYRCGAYNPYLQNSNGGSFNTLTVNSVSNPPASPPTGAFWSSSPTIAVVGRSARLACFFYGYPTPTVTWLRVNGGLPEGRYTMSYANTVLTIDPVESSDQNDVYQCTGQNSVGSLTQTIQLNVQAEPTFNSGPVNINATDGQNVSFYCNVTGIPTPAIMWYQNLRSLEPSRLPAKFSMTSDSKILTITNVCKQCPSGQSDLQVIQCNASNAQGYAYGSGYLNVLTQTTIVNYPKSQALVYNAETVLTCGTSHDPSTPVTISWYFNDQPFVNNPGQVYADAEGNIHFNTPSLPNGGAAYAGNYTCIVSNGYSEDQASAIIYPAAMIYQSSVADFWWIFVIIAVVLLLIIGVVLIVVYMRRNRGDSYPVDEKEKENGNDPDKELADGAFQDYQRSEAKAPLIPPGSMSDSMPMHSDAGSSMNEYVTTPQSKFDDKGAFVNNSIAGYSQQGFQY